ncbi:MAG: aromatic aminobenezylarsenical efflux permease ArsG family transporter, partial [bacterium]
MEALLIGMVSALWLGILTSISPCPLATNVVAILYLTRRVGNPRSVLLTGLFYTIGRTFTYTLLGLLIVGGAMAITPLSIFLQKNMNQFLGPLLILVGMCLLDLISLSVPRLNLGENFAKRSERLGVWGGGMLGIVFALAFCPVSAALYFGALIPLALRFDSALTLPAFYGIGTALPVVMFAVAIAGGARSVGKMMDRMKTMERWMSNATGVALVLTGIFFSLR